MRKFPERDWKKLRSIKDKLLQNACENILEEVENTIKGRGTESHKAYLALWKLMKKEDEEIALMFDDLKRSTAIYKLAAWKRNKLLTEDDLKEFSEETQSSIDFINQL